jgi:1-acyl-sn-glycerol-3-phosphate acyltransferase
MKFRTPARVAAIGGVSAAMLTALAIEERVREVTFERRDAYVRRWAGTLLRLLAVDVRIDAASSALAKGTRPRLVVANHRSTLDILLLLSLFGGNLLARGDMADWPLIGVLARRAGTLFVDRGDPASGAAAVQRIRERLRQGVTIGVFPEGTTYAGDEVREFQGGAFIAIARESGDVVPVGIAYEQPEAVYGDEPVMDHMKRLVGAPLLRVGVAVGEAVVAPRTHIRSLADSMRREVQALVYRARALTGGARSVEEALVDPAS